MLETDIKVLNNP